LANDELKKLDQAKSDFISIASHQLRTPLTVIKGYGSMMLEGSFGQMPAPIKDNLQKIYDSNERLIALVEDLLNISRIESGRLQYNWEIGQLEEMVGSVCEELKGNAVKKGLKFEYAAPAKPLAPIKLDKTKLRQVAINLIDNSIKYTEKGGLAVSLSQEGNNLKFCVADTGMGIRPDELPNLFKKFSRGEETSIVHTEGTGLGLYVGKMMVEAHGGRIWAESEGEGKGAKFCFEIPIADGKADVKPTIMPAPANTSVIPAKAGIQGVNNKK
jgi:signal transduction histidine kinase